MADDINRVELEDGTVLMDISSDTVTSDTLLSGITAHMATGAAITGTFSNYVTLNTTQTITGEKTFAGNVSVNAPINAYNNSTFNNLSAITITNTPITLNNSSVTGLSIAAANVTGLKTVATNGSYNDLSNRPTSVSQFTNDRNYLNKSTLTGNVAASNVSGLATIATTGNLSDAIGTLPLEQGGTGRTSAPPDYAIIRASSNSTTYPHFAYEETASGALYATAANGHPKFGTLPVAQGGTGVTSMTDLFATSLGSNNAGTITYGASGYKEGSFTMSKSGYYPLSLTGFKLDATYGATYLVPLRVDLSDAESGTATVSYKIKNTLTSANATNATIYARILWVKE